MSAHYQGNPVAAGLKINRLFYANPLTNPSSPCIILIMENKKVIQKRPSKKLLLKAIADKGVDKKIVESLGRANIDSLVFVKELLS